MADEKRHLAIDLDLLHAVTQSRSAGDLQAVATIFCARHGFARWIYGMAGPDDALTNYPDAWVASYRRNRWHRVHDPLVEVLNERRRAVSWNLRDARPFERPLDKVQRGILGERWEAGMRAGVSAPAYDCVGNRIEYAILSFSRDSVLTDTERRFHEPRVQLFAAYFQSVAPSVLLPATRPQETCTAKLTPREHDCLSWAANGKSSWAIGQLLSISEATVNFHLANAANKLGVRGRTLAIAKAMRLGLINPV